MRAARRTRRSFDGALACLIGVAACTGVPAETSVTPQTERLADAAVSDDDRARVERWYAAKDRGHIETRPPSPRWGSRWLFINGREVDLEAFTACVTTPGRFRLGAGSQARYGERHVESICCPDRTIFIDSAGQACAPWSTPGRCQHEEWLELMLSADGSVLAIEAHAPACDRLLPPPEPPGPGSDAPPIGAADPRASGL